MTSIVEAMADEALFAPHFRDLATWRAWVAILKAVFALPLDRGERAIYRKLTGRSRAPTKPAEEAWLIIGRRGGKSRGTALIAIYLATFRDWSQHLAPGERGVVVIVAADRKQARVVYKYAVALLHGVPMLARLIERETAEAIDLSNGISIEIMTANFRTLRGYTVVAVLADEVAFWRSDESANPDREILDALRPAMATIPGALLIGLGTPYRRSGVLYEAHRDHWGRDGDPVLVVKADTRTMNPTVPKSVISRAYERDPVSAAAEFGADFRSDIAGFLAPEWIDAAVDEDRPPELPPRADVRYQAFADPSGGPGDAFALAIGHAEGDLAVIDVIRARRPPFNPKSVVAEFSELAKGYACGVIQGDRYGGAWIETAFRDAGVSYRPSKLPKSEIYLETGPLFAQGRVRLPDEPSLLSELRQLERRTRSGGKDLIDHPPRAHDDRANVAAGVLHLVAGRVSISAADFAIVMSPVAALVAAGFDPADPACPAPPPSAAGFWEGDANLSDSGPPAVRWERV